VDRLRTDELLNRIAEWEQEWFDTDNIPFQ
jgi:hypothetical protein